MDYSGQLATIISRLNDVISKLEDINSYSVIIIALVSLFLVLNAIKGE